MSFLTNPYRYAVAHNFDLGDLKCYYRFEQTSGNLENTASDVGSSDAIADSDLVNSNATQGATGKIDYGTTFAAGLQTLKAAVPGAEMDPADLGFISNDGAVWTICGWVKATNRAGDQAIISDSDMATSGFWIRLSDTSGHLQLIFGTQGDDKIVATSATVALPDAEWNFLMVQYDNSTGNVKMSVNDGTVETVTKSAGTTLSNTDEPETYLYLGNLPALDNDFIGSLDEFVIFNRILTADEIESLYNSADGLVIT